MTDQNLPVKAEQPSVDDITAAIMSFSDVNIVSSVFKQFGWSCTDEILETLSVARQDKNLGAKMTAIKHLRKLLQESAEASGMVANISQTIPGTDGSQTTFSAKRVAAALNPVKQVEQHKIQENTNDVEEEREREQTEEYPGSSGIEDGRVTARDGGRNSEQSIERGISGGSSNERGVSNGPERDDICGESSSGAESNSDPCVECRPPTCDPKLFPGIAGLRIPSAGE